MLLDQMLLVEKSKSSAKETERSVALGDDFVHQKILDKDNQVVGVTFQKKADVETLTDFSLLNPVLENYRESFKRGLLSTSTQTDSIRIVNENQSDKGINYSGHGDTFDPGAKEDNRGSPRASQGTLELASRTSVPEGRDKEESEHQVELGTDQKLDTLP